MSFPLEELWLIDTTVRMFTEPVFRGDLEVLKRAHAEDVERKRQLLKRVATHAGCAPGASEEQVKETVREVLGSSDKFAGVLRSLGVEPPLKPGKKGQIYAFAKTDPGMQTLLEHERDEIRWLAEARVGVKSNLVETRSAAMIGVAKRGPIPFYLNAYGAHTHRWCMKPDVEVLTQRGWARVDSVSSEIIAQWSPDGSVVWAAAHMNSFDYSGEMVRIDSNYIRGAFTPDHLIPCWTTKGSFRPKTAAAARGKNLRVPVGGTLLSGGVPVSDALLRLVAAVQADGCIEDKNRRPLRFKFRKRRKIDRLRKLLDDAGIPFTEFETPPEHCISVAREIVPPLLWRAKRFSWKFLDMNPAQREVFLEELRYWDGRLARGGLEYTTTVRENAEIVAALAVTSGRTASVCVDPRSCKNPRWADRYTVCMQQRPFVHVTSQRWGSETYTGRVFCPSTKTGYFIVRSEGTIFVTGNSGGGGINPQNFNRGGALRDAILAPEGHVLGVADSGQIEARGVAWLAGQTNLLDTFRRNDSTEGGDFYSDIGSTFFGRKLSKKETPTERQVSKSMVLGLGYGMGWAKFATELLKGMLGAPPVQFGTREVAQYGVNVAAFEAEHGARVRKLIADGARVPYEELLPHCAVAEYFVRLYRAKNPKIVALWETMNGVIASMARGERRRVGCLQIIPGGIVKPNGLVLLYPDLRRDARGQWSYQNGRKRSKIYGGLLTENVVQSLARDVVAEQILWIRAGGWRVGTCTHDEAVAVAPEERGEECLAYMIERMRIPPAWCADLPLNAEGGIGRSYGSAK